MPIYEYECQDCKEIFETLVTSASSEEEISCSKCGSTDTKKIMSSGNIRSGSGVSLPSAPPAGCGSGGFS